MARLARTKLVRWGLPVAIVAVVGGGAALVPVVAGADPSLTPRTAAQLLSQVATARTQPFSGTVVQTLDLGLPSLPSVGGSSDLSLTSLASGTHTARVWYAGPDAMRVALLGAVSETDVVRKGTDVWVWQSGPNSATHLTVPAGQRTPSPAPTSTLTPQQAAQQALAAVDPTTKVSVDGTARVAGRDAYELVLEPKSGDTLVGSVRVAVDSKTALPLRVQVYAKAQTKASIEVGFTSVAFAKPAASVFSFTPPPGAKVREQALGNKATAGANAPDGSAVKPGRGGPATGEPTVIGTGWSSVLALKGDPAQTGSGQVGNPGKGSSGGGSGQSSALLKAMTPVSGAYGSGRALSTKLLSVLMLDDGRTFVGAVPLAVLEQAATAAATSTPGASAPAAAQ